LARLEPKMHSLANSALDFSREKSVLVLEEEQVEDRSLLAEFVPLIEEEQVEVWRGCPQVKSFE